MPALVIGLLLVAPFVLACLVLFRQALHTGRPLTILDVVENEEPDEDCPHGQAHRQSTMHADVPFPCGIARVSITGDLLDKSLGLSDLPRDGRDEQGDGGILEAVHDD